MRRDKHTSAKSGLSASFLCKARRALQRVFSFPSMLASLLALLAVLTCRERFDDPDMWWHLKIGEIIWKTHTIPLTDVFSYTTHHQAYIPQEWLSQVSIYAAYRFCGGYSGLMLWFCVLTVSILVAGYCLCSLYSGNAKTAFVGAMAIWFFGTIGFSMRPHLIAFLLFIAELLLIHLGRTRSPLWFAWLPVLFALWINCHGSFILGIIVGGVFLFSSFFSFQLGSLVSERWNSHVRTMFVVAMVVSLAALFANPVGVRQILYPFDTLLNMHGLMTDVEEWAPLRMTDARGVGLLIVLLCCCLVAITHRAELFWDELLLLSLGTWLAVSHERMLFVFGILAAPLLSRQISTLWEAYDIENDHIWPNAILIGLSLLGVVLAFPNLKNLQLQVENSSPVKAVEFIKANHLSGPMLNEYVFGGYLIWAAPEHPVMMDGRTDLYEWSGFLGEYGNWAKLQSDPNAFLDKYKVNFCLLSSHSRMVHVLPLLHDWKVSYADKNAVVFKRISPESGAARSSISVAER